MKALLVSILPVLFFLITTSKSEEDDLCETVRFIKKKVYMRCCQIEKSTLDNSEQGETTIKMDGIILKCEEKIKKVPVASIVSPKAYERAEKENSSDGVKKIAPNLANRNFGDVPSRCPDDTVMDSSGDCVEVWE